MHFSKRQVAHLRTQGSSHLLNSHAPSPPAPALILVTLDATLQLCEIFDDTKDCKKHSFKRNNSLHVYYASLREQRKPKQQANPRERMSTPTVHSTKCCGLAPPCLGPASSTDHPTPASLVSSWVTLSVPPPVTSC